MNNCKEVHPQTLPLVTCTKWKNNTTLHVTLLFFVVVVFSRHGEAFLFRFDEFLTSLLFVVDTWTSAGSSWKKARSVSRYSRCSQLPQGCGLSTLRKLAAKDGQSKLASSLPLMALWMETINLHNKVGTSCNSKHSQTFPKMHECIEGAAELENEHRKQCQIN